MSTARPSASTSDLVVADAERPGRDDQDALFREHAATRSRRVRNTLVESHIGLARHIARRYGSAGREDVEQVALLGLVKSVDRFDPDRGVAFSTFAGRTIEGELKRHFRDSSWDLRVPRSLKELHVSVRRGSEDLTQTLGRSPTMSEVADHLGVDPDDVVAAMGASSARDASSLDAPSAERPTDHVREIGADGGFEHVEDRDAVEDLMDTLEPREREIVRLRFYENLSQDDIARQVGISQMHVSRLLRRSIEDMRRRARSGRRSEPKG